MKANCRLHVSIVVNIIISHVQWSFGVTCWEVYSGGSTPYPGMNDPKTLVDFIHGGGRLDKPTSITCSDEMYSLCTGTRLYVYSGTSN